MNFFRKSLAKRRILASGLFDAEFYLKKYPDVAAAGQDPLEHFLVNGGRESRSPSWKFDGPYYALVNAAAEGADNNLLDWLREGRKGRRVPPQPLPEFFNAIVPDAAPSDMDEGDHYQWAEDDDERALRTGSEIDVVIPAKPVGEPGAAERGWNGLPTLAPRPSRWVHNTAAIARNRPQPLAPYTRTFNPKSLNIHWIVPDFGPGGGGHMSIFRMVRFLEIFGHRQTIWIQNPSTNKTEREAWDNIRAWYQPINRVIVRFLPEEVEGISGDLVIATDMWTTFPAAQMTMMKERFYLVQDYEVLFHTHGTFSYVADMTYRMGFKAVCAGAWLKSICEGKYGLWTRSWNLAHDPMHYYAEKDQKRAVNKPLRIAFYSRASTPRRAVELGLEALDILHERGVKFRVDLFGQNDMGARPPYEHVQHGLLTPAELGDLYRQCDVGLVFSATNYSLIPMEMMACDLPVVELDGESTRAVFPEDAVALAPPTPHSIADTLQDLLASKTRRDRLRDGGARYVAKLSWEKSARALEAALVEGLSENNEAVTPQKLFSAADYTHKAAVIIPTWNAGAPFRAVLEALVAQQTNWPFDILVVDSGSSDNTLEIIGEFKDRGVRLHQIPNSKFQHGRTRNLAISLTSAEFVGVLTQDAIPANPFWLANLVKAFDMGERIAGVFGPHLVYPDATQFVRHSQDTHFAYFNALPHVAQWDVAPHGLEWGSIQHQQWLHYYSDNNSMMRRSVWEKIPYPEVHWAEDQLWAWEVIKQGYQKAFAHDAYVIHSHNMTKAAQAKVAKIEGDLFLRFFGYRFEKNPEEVQRAVEGLNIRDGDFAKRHGIADDVLEHQKVLNVAQISGRYLGQFELIKEWVGKWC